MNRRPERNLPLLHPTQTWEHLPETVRQQALDVLTTLCLQAILSPPRPEPHDHEPSSH